MADFFCDHGAYGLATNRLGLDVPVTWGVPQEGDGSSKDAATASSVASIQFTANASGTASIVGICGVTFTSTTNFAIGGTLSITLDNLVAAINANAGQGAVAVAASVAVGVPKVCNLVYARKTSTDTLQVMMRIGSDKLNNATNANATLTIAGWTNNGVTNFAGGSGGCWGWFLNTAAMGVSSSIAIATYGTMMHKPYVTASTVPSTFDRVYHRSGGGASKAIVLAPAGALTVSRTAAYLPQHVVDTNTKWTGDSAVGTLSLQINITTANAVTFTFDADAGVWSLSALRRGGFALIYNPTANGALIFQANSQAGAIAMKRWRITDNGSTTARYIDLTKSQSAARVVSVVDVDYDRMTSQITVVGPFYSLFNNYAAAQVFSLNGCTFNYNISSVSDPGSIFGLYSAGTSDALLEIINCKFTGFSDGFNVLTLDANVKGLAKDIKLSVINCAGLKIPPAYLGWPKSEQSDLRSPERKRLFWSSSDAFRYENLTGVAEWLSSSAVAFPYLVARRQDGVTGWSVRAIWLPSILNAGWAFTLPELKQTSKLSAGAAVSLKLFAPSTESLSPSGVTISMTYWSAGVMYTEAMPTPVTDTSTWTNNGLYAGYTARKCELTTANPIAQDTEVTITMVLHGNPDTGAVTQFYTDPEFSIT